MTDNVKTEIDEYDELVEKLKNNVGFRGAMSKIMQEDFFSYIVTMFFLFNQSRMMLKDFHRIVIKKLDDLVKGKNEKRNLCLSLPVGAGKSLLTQFFISWCFARTPNNAFVYTSHSEDLITKMSNEIRAICTHPMWVLLFGHVLKKDDRQKTKFSFEGARNRTGMVAKAMNSAITGLDCGNPSVKGFSGALVLDDVMDAGNAVYEIERENVIRVYNEKLATRRRTPTTPTILIMQRLHPDDLAGWIEHNQKDLWDIVKVPALDENGNSFWEERYPKEELEMLRDRQPEMFQSQYQQEPIIRGGQLIKTNWFNYYTEHPRYEMIYITADTAQTVKEYSDYSVFMVWGKYNNNLYLIDMIHEKLEIPDLIKRAKDVTNKYKVWQNYLRLSFLAIEDRSSGTALIQQLRRETTIPILPYKVKKKDKVTRVKDILYYIEAGKIFLPFNRDYSFVPTFLAETEMFDAMGTAKHDDIVDVLTMGIKYGLAGEGCSIFD